MKAIGMRQKARGGWAGVAGLGLMVGHVLAAMGCSRSQWGSAYVGSRVGPSTDAEPVQIRSVPWERIDATLKSLEMTAAASDALPDEWPAAQKAEAHAELLRGLQVMQDPRRVDVLGRAEFATTSDLQPDQEVGREDLEAFARKVGADTVVWSSRPLGQPAENVGPSTRGRGLIAFFLRMR